MSLELLGATKGGGINVHKQGFGALGVAFHTCGVWDRVEEPQVGQPAKGWRQDSNRRATFTAAL